MNCKRTYFKAIQTELDYKDKRSVLRWCRINGIQTYRDLGTKRYYVLTEQYESILNKIVPQHFIENLKIPPKGTKVIKLMNAKGHHESEFLARLHKIKDKI